MPLDEVTDRSCQGIRVDITGQAQGHRDVVGGARALEPVEEPQASLRERQRHLRTAFHRHQRRAGLAPLTELRGQAGHRGRLEQGAQRKLDAEDGARPGDQPRRHQRMPAELEEAVVDTDRRHAEELGEYRAQDLFLRRARRAGGEPADHTGLRQGLAVQLSVRGQRERVQGDEGRRNHVLGHRGAHVFPQLGRPGNLESRGRDQIGDQPPVTGLVLPDDHDRLLDVLVRGEHRDDLVELDAESADLHLVVGAADEFQFRPGAGAGFPGAFGHRPPDHVAGAVHPRSRRVERIGDEPLRRQPGTAEVATGEGRPGDVQFPGDSGQDRTKGPVQHVEPGAGQRATDRGRPRAGQRTAHRGTDRRLGRTVGVHHQAVRRPLLHHFARGGLAGDDEGSHRRQVPGQQHRQRRRRDRGVGDLVLGDHVDEGLSGRQPLRRGEHRGAAREQRHAQLPERGVEAGRGELQHPAARPGGELRGVFGREALGSRVGHHDALGPPGRTRRVDHVGGADGQQRRSPVGVGRIGLGAARQ